MTQPAAVSAPLTPPAPQEWWVPTEGGHQLRVLEVRPAQPAPGTPGVLFLHGLFSDGRFFLSERGEGPAQDFVEQGFTVYVADLRGHGRSRWPERRAYDWTFDTYARHDIPDLVRAVRARHTGSLFLLAHSMAGYAALAGLGLQPEVQGMLSGVCVLSSAVNDYTDGGLKKRAMLGFSTLLSGLLGRFPARALKQGPADEPAGVMRQFTDWAPTGAFRSADGRVDYWEVLGRVTLPVLAGIGEADVFHASPRRAEKLVSKLGSAARTLMVCGRSHGFESDFGHFDIVRGRRARREVLPRIHAWMRELARAA